MPLARNNSCTHRQFSPVPHVVGYNAALHIEDPEVYTHLDLPLADVRDVVPCGDNPYPTLDEVITFPPLLFLLLTLFQINRRILEVCSRGSNNGEIWDDLRLNDVIMAQFQASSVPTEASLMAWEREIMSRLLHLEVRMVSGERALQASSLFTRRTRTMIVHCWNRVHEIREEFSHVDALEELVTEQRNMLESLTDRVRILEGWVNRGHRSNWSFGSSRSSGMSHSSGGSSYGTPGEVIHQAPEVPERLEGFVGDGSEERLYTHVIVD